MSYTRSYRETVTQRVSKTVSVSYPASQNGGSKSVTVDMTAEIPVEVNIHVDTNPFDKSVEHCDNNINLLTAAVVATEAAEVAEKKKNSKKVADTIIGGFFGYIRSEISQQVAELSQNIDAQMMHLKELAKSCLAKKTQMESDYGRISQRYAKIFTDLNVELSNRIHELDRPVFTFKKESDAQKVRTSGNDLINTVTVFGKESGDLQSRICTSNSKKRAFDTLSKASMFLLQQKKMNMTLQQSIINSDISGCVFVPVSFIEVNNKGLTERSVYTTEYFPQLKEDKIKSEIAENFRSSFHWDRITEADEKNIRMYFNTELNNMYPGSDKHSVSVREMIQRIAKINSTAAIKL